MPKGQDKAKRLRSWIVLILQFSPLTRRVLGINLLAVLVLVAGLLYLSEYRRLLIRAALDSLHIQAEVIATSLGLGAVESSKTRGIESLIPKQTKLLLQRMARTTGTRARLFAADGRLLVDSYHLTLVDVESEPLAPPGLWQRMMRLSLIAFERFLSWLPPHSSIPLYHEPTLQSAGNYFEANAALHGENQEAVRRNHDGQFILSVAVPVQRYRQIVGALLLSHDAAMIEAAVRRLRLNILWIVCLALLVTFLFSLYLASTITAPIALLARAADRLRRRQDQRDGSLNETVTDEKQNSSELDSNYLGSTLLSPLVIMPDLSSRGDEIGDLSAALREMTGSLWARMDAIERFAADVAHELKNPLSSLRAAVETLPRVAKDPTRQAKLLTVIENDIMRLDRLITDTAAASRLDAELAQAPGGSFNLIALLYKLYNADRSDGPNSPELRLFLPTIKDGISLQVTDGKAKNNLFLASVPIRGTWHRILQAFENLIENARSFSPPTGYIDLKLHFNSEAQTKWAVLHVLDQGPGLPPANLETIFQRFYSERPAGEKFGTHSGLGLSIARQIIESHAGTLHSENRPPPEQGACFIVKLPLITSHAHKIL